MLNLILKRQVITLKLSGSIGSLGNFGPKSFIINVTFPAKLVSSLIFPLHTILLVLVSYPY